MKKPRLSIRSILVAGVLVFLCPSCWLLSAKAASTPAAGAKISFKRVFQGSSPELIEITLRDDSDAATYEIRQLDEDPGALPFEVSGRVALPSKLPRSPDGRRCKLGDGPCCSD